jgi:hypothetical protein
MAMIVGLSIYLFIFNLLKDVVSIPVYITSNNLMIANNKLERTWKEVVVSYYRVQLSSPRWNGIWEMFD